MLVWEGLRSTGRDLCISRAKVPGGWLVYVREDTFDLSPALSLTFYPDSEHKWDGSSLP